MLTPLDASGRKRTGEGSEMMDMNGKSAVCTNVYESGHADISSRRLAQMRMLLTLGRLKLGIEATLR